MAEQEEYGTLICNQCNNIIQERLHKEYKQRSDLRRRLVAFERFGGRNKRRKLGSKKHVKTEVKYKTARLII